MVQTWHNQWPGWFFSMSVRNVSFSRVWEDKSCQYWRPTTEQIDLLQKARDAAELRGSWRAICCKSSEGSLSNMEVLSFLDSRPHLDSKCAMIGGGLAKKMEGTRWTKEVRAVESYGALRWLSSEIGGHESGILWFNTGMFYYTLYPYLGLAVGTSLLWA